MKQLEKDIVDDIRKNLLNDGMLWGKELEEYIKLSCMGQIVFKSEKHYSKFEEEVLKSVETNRKKYVITNVETEEEFEFETVGEAEEFTGVKSAQILTAISKRKIFHYGKYKARRGKRTIQEITWRDNKNAIY